MSNNHTNLFAGGGVGGKGVLGKKGGMGMCSPEDPLSVPHPQFTRVPFQAKELKSQFTRPPLKKNGNFSFYGLNFCPHFSSQAPKFENFSSQDPSFRGKNQFAIPTFRNSRLHTPTWKKKEVEYLSGAWPTTILVPFLSFSQTICFMMLIAHIDMFKEVDNFEVAHETCLIFILRCSSPIKNWNYIFVKWITKALLLLNKKSFMLLKL